ncbi:Hypothetical predicted protein [Marmota monax]|uniref:Uncharacterized protein n=1 Tax=Marmota monax TaxID=9995 RepID=A0A5E4B2G8_MARMO|nr:hypothetical protein GHT09_017742 [Marmota monax]VTJ63261.1 Hypothetical predicted protein [Marmota monax]
MGSQPHAGARRTREVLEHRQLLTPPMGSSQCPTYLLTPASLFWPVECQADAHLGHHQTHGMPPKDLDMKSQPLGWLPQAEPPAVLYKAHAGLRERRRLGPPLRSPAQDTVIGSEKISREPHS